MSVAHSSFFDFFAYISATCDAQRQVHSKQVYEYRKLRNSILSRYLPGGICETKHKLAGGICEAKIQFCLLFVCSLFCLLVEPFTPIGHPAFLMGAGLPICVLFVLEPFTPIGHKALFRGAGLPLVYFMCFLDVVGGDPWAGNRCRHLVQRTAWRYPDIGLNPKNDVCRKLLIVCVF